MEQILAITVVLLVLVVVVGIFYKVLKVAMWAAIIAVFALIGWTFVRDQAPPELRERVEKQAADLADKGEDAARAWGAKAAEAGGKAAKQLGQMAAEKVDHAVDQAMSGDEEEAESKEADKPAANSER